MKKTVTLIFVVLSLAGCRAGKPEAGSAAEARAAARGARRLDNMA